MIETWNDATAAYDELLDTDGDVTVAGLPFQPSKILRQLDPIAYRTGLLDWLDSEGIDSDTLSGELRE